MFNYENMIGTVTFSSDYLTKLIGKAVSSCYGVVGMVPGDNKQKFFNLFSKKDYLKKGISVNGTVTSLSAEIHIIVMYGMNINAIAESIIHKVKYTVEEATGIKVKKITVKVDGIKE